MQFLFFSPLEVWGIIRDFFLSSVRFPPNNQWGLIGIQTLYLYKYYFSLPRLLN